MWMVIKMNTYKNKKLIGEIILLVVLALSLRCTGVAFSTGSDAVEEANKKDTTNCTLLLLLNSSQPLIPLLGNNDICKYSMLASAFKPAPSGPPQCLSTSTSTRCDYSEIESNNSQSSANLLPFDKKYSSYKISGYSEPSYRYDYDQDYFLFRPTTSGTYYIKAIGSQSGSSYLYCSLGGYSISNLFNSFSLSSTSDYSNFISCYSYYYDGESYAITISTENTDKAIFLTSTTYNGNLGGYAGADTKCNSDSNRPSTSKTYKAVLFGSTTSPLKADTSYYKYDSSTGNKSLMAVTDSNGKLPTSVVSNFDSNYNYWWSGYTYTCSDWNSTSGSGTVGSTTYTSSYWYSSSTGTCSAFARLVCVEQ